MAAGLVVEFAAAALLNLAWTPGDAPIVVVDIALAAAFTVVLAWAHQRIRPGDMQ